MGALVGSVQVNGTPVPYILFLASGSICMSAMNAASFEALYSAFSRMHVQKTWDAILNAPVALDDVVLGEAGVHSRTSVGAFALPKNATVDTVRSIGGRIVTHGCARRRSPPRRRRH